MTKKLIIPVFIPHMGCPHTCVFCNQKRIAGSFEPPQAGELGTIVDSYRQTAKDINSSFVELAFYGGSFTGIDVELQERLLGEASDLKQEQKINAIRMSTRPDYINPQVISRLKQYGVDTVELGVQSLDWEVLDKSERGHSSSEVVLAVKALKDNRIQVGIQLMPGLPEDTEARVLETTKKVIQLQPDFVRIYPTVIIKETKLADWYSSGIFQPWSLEKAVEIVAKMYILFTQRQIPIIRMGLQATESLVPDRSLVAGPYHPAFGELVKSRVFRKQLEYLLQQENRNHQNQEMEVLCNPQEVSQIKGQNKENIQYFHIKYNLKLMVSPKNNVEKGTLIWKGKNETCSFFPRREFLQRYRIN